MIVDKNDGFFKMEGMINVNWLDSPSNLILGKSLDALWQRQQVIADNIANSATPGYKRKSVAFEDVLAKKMAVMSNTQSRRDMISEIKQIQPQIDRDTTTIINADGNNVDIDYEFMQLTETTLRYQYIQRLLNDDYSRLRYAITEGRG